MLLLIKYCKHCGIRYSWQASGSGFWESKNTEDYCESCWKAITEALEKIPKKVEKRFIKTNEITYEDAINAINEANESARKNNEMPRLIRYFGTMRKEDTGEYSRTREFKINNIKYIMFWFESEPENAVIKKEVYWDLINDKELIDY